MCNEEKEQGAITKTHEGEGRYLEGVEREGFSKEMKNRGKSDPSRANSLCGDLEAGRSLKEAKGGGPARIQSGASRDEFLRNVTSLL